MAKFRKVDPRMWRDERFAKLTVEEKLVAVYCLTAQCNRCGIFVFSPAMAAEELGMVPETFRERFGNVILALRWRWDEGCRVLYFPTWWKYNAPENTNVLLGNLRDITDLPETHLLQAFYGNLDHLPPNLRETFRERSGERYPKPSPIQEQEQEQYLKPPLPPVPGGGGVGGEQQQQPKKPRRRKPIAPHPLFAKFWMAYPKKVGKEAAVKAFAKIAPDDATVDAMLAALSWQGRSDGWVKDNGAYIPHPATWLNGKRWEDERVAGMVVTSPPDPDAQRRENLLNMVSQGNMTREEAEAAYGGPLDEFGTEAA